MATPINKTSFAGGELSPNLFARVDLEKYQSGAQTLKNFFVDYRGGVSNRSGTEYITRAGNDDEGEVRLIPFIFSREQSYVLEFSDGLLRIYSNKVFVTQLTSPYAGEDVFQLKYVQSADILTITHPAYPIYNLIRTSATTFVIEEEIITPSVGSPTSLAGFPSVVGTYKYGYTVTCISESGEESLPCLPVVVESALLDPTVAIPQVISLGFSGPGFGDRVVAVNVYKWGPIPASVPLPTVFGYIGQSVTATFTDNNIAPDFAKTPPEYRDPFSPGQIITISATAAGAGYDDYTELTVSGDGVGAEAYAVANGGAITGVIITSPGRNYTAATAAQAGGTPGAGATFAVSVDLNHHYPAAVSYFQQRRCYGGADISPELVEFSQTGHYSNFDITPTVLDSDAISVNIASREINTIKSFVPMSTGLVTFTTGMAFLINGNGSTSPITPGNVAALPQAANGAADLQPIVVNYNILFPQYQGSTIRDLSFNFGNQSYYGVDRTMLANHLIRGFTLVDWAWAEEPNKLLWVARSDGKAIVMTYVPDQEVYGWSHHETLGRFMSVCCVPEGNENAVYFITRRWQDGTPDEPAPIPMTSVFECMGLGNVEYESAVSWAVDWDGGRVVIISRGVGVGSPIRLRTCSLADGGFIDEVLENPSNGFFADIIVGLDGYFYWRDASGDGPFKMDLDSLTVVGQVSFVVNGNFSHPCVIKSVNGPYVWIAGRFCCGGDIGTLAIVDVDSLTIVSANWGAVDENYPMHVAAPSIEGRAYIAACHAFGSDPTQPIGVYRVNVTGSPPVPVLTKLGTFTFTDIDPTWVQFGEVTGPSFDETDGNLLMQFRVDGGFTGYIAKISTTDGSVLWTIPVSAIADTPSLANNVYQYNVTKYGQFVHLAGTNKYTIDTIAGTSVTSAITGYTGAPQVFNDATGHKIVRGTYTPSDPGPPPPPDAAGYSNPAGWLTQVSFLGPVIAPVAKGWKNLVERLSTRDVKCCPQLGTFLDSFVLSDTTLGEFILQIEVDETSVILTAPEDVENPWSALTAGDFILYGCGVITFDSFLEGSNEAFGTIVNADFPRSPGNSSIAIPALPGKWSWNPPITTLTGLTHLIGYEVRVITDGVIRELVTLDDSASVSFAPCARAIVGIPYQSQLKTLRLDAGEPTVQGRRKTIPAVTARLECAAGIKIGTEEDQPLYDYLPSAVVVDAPVELFTGDERIIVDTTWEERGHIIVQQDWPLPVTVLGLIPEVVIGDTQR